MAATMLGLCPKGSAWLLHHRRYVANGSVVNWAFVFDYHEGLTAHEAWAKAKLPDGPPFYEVVAVQLQPFPVSVNTRLSERQQRAILQLARRAQGMIDYNVQEASVTREV